jgi:hypothetical protein
MKMDSSGDKNAVFTGGAFRFLRAFDEIRIFNSVVNSQRLFTRN